MLKGDALVTIQIQGGLGNQLFQAAAAYLVSKVNHQNQMRLDVTRIPFGTDPTRQLEINKFDLFPTGFSTLVEGKLFAKLVSVFPRQFASQVIRGHSFLTRGLGKKNGSVFFDDKNIESLEKLNSEFILNGYFNNFDIVRKAENYGFSRELKLKYEPSGWLTDYIAKSNFENSTALHIRLGDYLKYPHIFGQLSEFFYLECLERLEVDFKDEVTIFSDQPNKVANLVPQISQRPRVRIFREPAGAASYETFYLMSKFKKIVCANSTFSMWAAWFNDIHENSKKVTVPSPYLLNEADMKTPESWIKVSRIG